MGETRIMDDNWITGEPPKKSGEYLVSTKNEFVVVARYLTGMGWNGQYKNCVVAWQELPKPYKEKEQV